MKTFEELKEHMLKTHNKERQSLINIEEMYNLAYKAAQYYNTESGAAWISYYPGGDIVTLKLEVEEGKHPVKEALFLIDEILYPEEWIEEIKYPEILEDDIYWHFMSKENNNVILIISVPMKTGGGCIQVGTGKYAEIMEWRCA
jgi:hypothetical protein